MAQNFALVTPTVIVDVNQIVAMVRVSENTFVVHLPGGTIDVAGEQASSVWNQLQQVSQIPAAAAAT